MAEFIITSPQGKKYKITAPDGATDDEVMAFAQQQFAGQKQPEQEKLKQADNSFVNALRTFGQGVTLNTADEIESFVTGRPVEEIRHELKAFSQDNPYLAPALEIGGGLTTLAVPGLGAAKLAKAGAGIGKTILTGAGTGAAMGGVSGFAGGEGGFENRAVSGAKGAALGGVAGGALAPAASAAQKIAGYARGALPGEAKNSAIKSSINALADDDITVNQLTRTADRLQRQNSGDTPIRLLDAARNVRPGSGSNVTGRVTAAAGRPRPAQSRITEEVVRNASAQKGRIASFIDQNFGGKGFDKAADKLSEGLSKNANDAYKALHSLPDINITPELGKILSNKDVQKALKEAQRIASAEGDEIAETLAASIAQGKLPVKAADYLQRSLRLMSQGITKDGTKKHAFKVLRQRLLKPLDKLVPDFKKIRDTYAFGMDAQDALKMGEKYVKTVGSKQREFLREFSKMTEPQQKLAQLGVARKIMDDIQTSSRFDQYLTGEATESIMKIFGKRQGRKLLRQLRIERRSQLTNNSFAGSRTTPLSENIQEGLETARIGGNALLGRFSKALEAAGDRFIRGVNSRNSDEIAQMWMTTSPAQQREILKKLSKAQKRGLRRIIRTYGISTAAAGGAGQAAGNMVNE